MYTLWSSRSSHTYPLCFFLTPRATEALFSSSSHAMFLPPSHLISLSLTLSLSCSLALCLEPGSRGYREFYDPPRRRKLEISHVKVDTTERARGGERGKPPRDAGGRDRGKVKKIRAKATAERLLRPPSPSPPPSCRLSRDSARLIRSRGRSGERRRCRRWG